MTAYEKMYLAMVIVGFVSFGIVLATMSYRAGFKITWFCVARIVNMRLALAC